jgi:drug/metabolite transporter (DMT)-like permease
MAIKYIIVALLIAIITATGNLILKIGSSKPSWLSVTWMPTVNVYFIIGGFLFGLSLLIYMFLLKDLPLFVAQSLIAMQYIAVMLIARFVLDEKMLWSDLIGMGLIVCGIILINQRSSV